MQGPACCALVLLLVLASAISEDVSMGNVSVQEQDQDSIEAMERRDGNETVPPPVAWGRMISQSAWQSKYDFVVQVTAIRTRGRARCTGIVWKDKVLTAAHCGRNAVSWEVTTATHTSGVSNVQIHPRYTRRASCRFDFLLLTLTKPMANRQSIALKSSDNEVGLRLMLVGLGLTARGDANPYPLPPRPVITTTHFGVIRCSSRLGVREECTDCISSGMWSSQSSCGADSGGPWMHWSPAQSVAIVAGVNSFGYDGTCGANAKKTGLAPAALAKPWIEQVAPAHFPWTS